MIKTENFAKVEISSTQELRSWLTANSQQTDSVWLVSFKKHVPEKYISRDEVLDELLCFGWIDGIRRKLDQDRTMQLISPRRAQHWAKTYKVRAERLIQEQKMAEPGYRSIQASKDKGLWNFQSFPDAVQRFTLRWIKLAKTEATRKRRIQKAAQLAQKNERIPGA